ncbi:MAG: ferredoxin reductase family protein [Candidatus Magasanikbacteria bacterium]
MKKTLLNIFLLLNLGIICFFWWRHSGSMLFATKSDVFISIARITGLLSVFFVLLQLILIGRVKWIERVYGLDKLSHAHHLTAFLTLFFVISHGLFVTFGYAIGSQISFFTQTMYFIKYWELLPAIISIFIFIFVFVSSLIIVIKKMKYETWYFIHFFSYLAILLAFSHQMELGGDFVGNIYFQTYWWLLYFFTFTNLFFYRFFLPTYSFYKHQFFVEKVEKDDGGAISIYISGKNLDKFKYTAGQFAIWRFLDKKRFLQAHPFSFSSSPQDKYLRITIKNLGDFTSDISNIKPKTRVIIDGPHGIFTAKRTTNKKLAFIAGGIGITPIKSILASLDENYQSIMFYCHQTSQDTIFKQEQKQFPEKQIKIIHILSKEQNNINEYGYIDMDKIKKFVPDYLERDFYICGPRPMVKLAIKILDELNVPKNKIYFEKFSLG